MRIATAAAHRAADQFAVQTLGIPGVCVMQSAGDALVRGMAELLGGICGRQITLLCGPDNTGNHKGRAATLRVALTSDRTPCEITMSSVDNLVVDGILPDPGPAEQPEKRTSRPKAGAAGLIPIVCRNNHCDSPARLIV